MKKARAAQVWRGLEKQLIERCGLPDGAMLDRERPSLIRRIGSALRGTAAAGDTVSPPLRLDDSAPALTFKSTKTVGHNYATVGRKSADTIHDPKLAAYLDRACSRRSGYDGDDSVGYS
jgi:hypothetical protein